MSRYRDIVFYIHGDMIEYGGELFSAGELTADILNLSLKDYQGIPKNVRRMKDLTEQYERTQDREFWRKLNYQFMALRKRMMEFWVFQILLRDDSKFFNEAQQYTEYRSSLPEDNLDYEDFSADQWVDMAEQAETTGQIPVPLLIFPGGRKTKWLYYRKQMNRYERYLGDVACFNPIPRISSRSMTCRPRRRTEIFLSISRATDCQHLRRKSSFRHLR